MFGSIILAVEGKNALNFLLSNLWLLFCNSIKEVQSRNWFTLIISADFFLEQSIKSSKEPFSASLNISDGTMPQPVAIFSGYSSKQVLFAAFINGPNSKEGRISPAQSKRFCSEYLLAPNRKVVNGKFGSLAR